MIIFPSDLSRLASSWSSTRFLRLCLQRLDRTSAAMQQWFALRSRLPIEPIAEDPTSFLQLIVPKPRPPPLQTNSDLAERLRCDTSRGFVQVRTGLNTFTDTVAETIYSKPGLTTTVDALLMPLQSHLATEIKCRADLKAGRTRICGLGTAANQAGTSSKEAG